MNHGLTYFFISLFQVFMVVSWVGGFGAREQSKLQSRSSGHNCASARRDNDDAMP